jgi:site-specific DNA-methyltransferase (adenine-specific)
MDDIFLKKSKEKIISYIQEQHPSFDFSNLKQSKKTKQNIIDEYRRYLYKQTIPNTHLILGDCIEEMKNIPSKTIDLIITDLPYGLTKNNWDIVIPFDKLWEQYNRIIKNSGAIILFGNQPFSSFLIQSNLSMFRYSLIWCKNKFSDFLNSNKKPMKIHEDILIFYKEQPTYNIQYNYSTPYIRWNKQESIDKQTNYNNYKETTTTNETGQRLPTTLLYFNRVERPIHPTQKPVDLLEWLIKSYSNKGDIVLDSCMGIGTTGLACKNTERMFIGIEINETYYNQSLSFINKE